jgi:hypothetical protein
LKAVLQLLLFALNPSQILLGQLRELQIVAMQQQQFSGLLPLAIQLLQALETRDHWLQPCPLSGQMLQLFRISGDGGIRQLTFQAVERFTGGAKPGHQE